MKILLQNKNIVLANNSLISINSDNIAENGNLVRIVPVIPEDMIVGDTFFLGKYQVESETPWPIEWEIVH